MLDKYKDHPSFPSEYILNEDMWEVKDLESKKIGIKGKYSFIAQLEGWNAQSLIPLIFGDVDVHTMSSSLIGAIDSDTDATGAFDYGVFKANDVEAARKKQAQIEYFKDEGYSKIKANVTGTILKNMSSNQVGSKVAELQKIGTKGLIDLSKKLNSTDLADLLGGSYRGTGTVLFDFDTGSLYIKHDKPKDPTIISSVQRKQNLAVSTDDYTTKYKSRVVFKPTETIDILNKIDISSYSLNQLKTLHDLNLYDILDKIGLDNISRGGVIKGSTGNMYVKNAYETSYDFKNLKSFKKALSSKSVGSSPLVTLSGEELPDSFYDDLKELFGTN